MKRLVLCFDGTWEARASYRGRFGDDPTNVEKTHIAVLKKDTQGILQVTAYYRGIGTKRLSRLWSGMTGAGISETICDAYAFIVDNFILQEDELYLFGFSRGAYTARSLSGFMQWIGALKKQKLSSLPDCYEQYRLPESKRDPAFRGEQLQEIRLGDTSIPIRFLGVWDTVGSLGIPIPGVNSIFDRRYVGFHDTELSKDVSYAFHALAVHELRSAFAPALWSTKRPGQTVEQAWFPGTHCGLGGGNPSHSLSDGAFLWMICHAERLGLEFDHAYLKQVAQPDCRDEIYDSSGGLWRLSRKKVRAIGASLDECRHSSLDDRLQYLRANPPKRYRQEWEQADITAQQQLKAVCPSCHHPAIPVEPPGRLEAPTLPDPEIEKAHRQTIEDKMKIFKKGAKEQPRPKPSRSGSEKKEEPKEK